MRRAPAVLAALLLAGCGGRAVSDVPVKIGSPYAVRGVTYTPAVDPTYDMLGYASWYGNESGRRTANGEQFRAKWITAAHTTLPMPTYVEVTALDTGRRIVVRVNDRGPFSGRGRIIDLSRGAAQALGARTAGQVPVRVRIVAPAQADRRRLRRGKPTRDIAPERPAILQNLRAQFAAGMR